MSLKRILVLTALICGLGAHSGCTRLKLDSPPLIPKSEHLSDRDPESGDDPDPGDSGNQGGTPEEFAGTRIDSFYGRRDTAGHADGIGTASRFNQPFGLTHVSGELYVADMMNSLIRRISLTDGSVSAFTGKRGTNGLVNGTGAAAEFSNPTGVVSDGTYLYVSDANNHVIRRVTIATAESITLAGTGMSGADDGVGLCSITDPADPAYVTCAAFEHPYGLALSADNKHLYVADSSNDAIRRIDLESPTRDVVTVASVSAVPVAALGFPTGIALSGSTLYVANANDQTIVKLDLTQTPLPLATTLVAGGSKEAGYQDDPIGANARFNHPSDIVQAGGFLYVSDATNRVIRRIDPTGSHAVTTFAGAANQAGSRDDVGPLARFRVPGGLATDGSYLYVSDISANNIRRISLSDATVTTVAGGQP